MRIWASSATIRKGCPHEVCTYIRSMCAHSPVVNRRSTQNLLSLNQLLNARQAKSESTSHDTDGVDHVRHASEVNMYSISTVSYKSALTCSIKCDCLYALDYIF